MTLNKQALAKKPPVSIRVFDFDEAGHDLLGSTEVPLHKITSAEHAKLDDEIVDGKVYKGRVLRLLPIQLVRRGQGGWRPRRPLGACFEDCRRIRGCWPLPG